jgi:hypothetical protein
VFDSRQLEGARVAMTLTNLSWNLARDRLLGDFGATSLGIPRVFGDPGYTHPNLELRIMVANAWISPGEASQELLDDFMQARKSASTRSEK